MASMSFRTHAHALCAISGVIAIASTASAANPAPVLRTDSVDRCVFALAYAQTETAPEHASISAAVVVRSADRMPTSPTDACTQDAAGAVPAPATVVVADLPIGVSVVDVLASESPLSMWSDADASSFADAVVVGDELGVAPGSFGALVLPASISSSLLALDNLSVIVSTPN
jgi:hypothetical protein